jgi:hypothetical protein
MGRKPKEPSDIFAEMVICAAIGRIDVTGKALADAKARGYNDKDIREIIETLRWKDYQYTVKSKDRLGTTQHVYVRKIKNVRWYIKVTIGSKQGTKGPWLIVTSFVEWDKPHVMQSVSRETSKNKKADKGRLSRRIA